MPNRATITRLDSVNCFHNNRICHANIGKIPSIRAAHSNIRAAMKTSDFDYELPPDLIAQTPMEPRDASRLLVLDRYQGEPSHAAFRDLPHILRRGDLLVFNDSRVFPARLRGVERAGGRAVELLLLSRLGDDVWRALVKPGRRMRGGARFTVSDPSGEREAQGEVVSVDPSGARIARFDSPESLADIGIVPLPPYIHSRLDDPERYQTVYASAEGSVAAPTAGLHFTQPLLDALDSMGVEKAFVTLHVGWDSFKPVRSEDPAEHAMHSEYWELSESAALGINAAKAEGRRVISVGTTAVRLLENAALSSGGADVALSAGSGWVDLFITPGFRFRVIDGLITNFHLPRSTLLMLVSAFTGRERVLAAYEQAVNERYRFYSFGDAMLIAR